MKGLFVFDDLHAEVEVLTRSRRKTPINLHISMTCHPVDLCGSRGVDAPVNGVVITPEGVGDQGIPFLVFAHQLEFPPRYGGGLSIDVLEQEVLWQPPECDLIALAIHDSLKGWDGQHLEELRDDMVRVSIARWLDRLAEAAGISRFCRSSGETVEYQHYLI